MIRQGGWYWFLSGEGAKLERHKCGKWMYFFEDQSFAQQICEKAIAEQVCYECKCTDMEVQLAPTVMSLFRRGATMTERLENSVNSLTD